MYCKWYIFADSRVTDTVLIVAKCIVNPSCSISLLNKLIVLIVAKCIVNLRLHMLPGFSWTVLIVAKCIVNKIDYATVTTEQLGINSSKVYCKWGKTWRKHRNVCVLIVAKCIVNWSVSVNEFAILKVLIVAKCIVNVVIDSASNNIAVY